MSKDGENAWQAPPLSERQERDRAVLSRAVRLAQQFESAYRPRRVRAPDDRQLLNYVAYAHLVRSIELCQGVHDLRESPVQYVLMRVLCETFINLHFIECEPKSQIERARNFHDFWNVNRWRLLREIGRRFPDVLEEANTTDEELRAELDVYRDRFSYERSDGSVRWDWDKRDLVSRVEACAKVLGSKQDDPARYRRIVALYQETNPYVHSGMRSLMDSLVAGEGDEAVHPRLISKEQPVSVSVLAACLLMDLIAACTRIFDCSDFDEQIQALWDECKRGSLG